MARHLSCNPFVLCLAAIALVLAVQSKANAADVSVAVAANFTVPAKEIAAKFEAESGHSVDLSFGSTGQLYAQITQGAPFDIFMSADSARAQKAVQAGLAVAGSRFTYAIGRLVLWSAKPGFVDDHGAVLKRDEFARLAIAKPATAPYGAAAIEVMKGMGVYESMRPKLVVGESVSQTLQFVATGNADLGFVALSQVIERNDGSRWVVPDALYAPILQDAVLLKTGDDNASAKAFISFMKSKAALRIIQRYGYALPSGT